MSCALIKFGKLFHKTLKKLPTILNKLSVIAVNQVLFWNRWNIASRPSRSKDYTQCIKLAESPRLLKLTLVIHSSHCIFKVTAYFDRICYGKLLHSWILWLFFALEKLGVIMIWFEALNLVNQLLLSLLSFLLKLELCIGLWSIVDDFFGDDDLISAFTSFLFHWLIWFHLTNRLLWIMIL